MPVTHKRWFSKRVLMIPWGLREGGREVEHPAELSMVGREGHRAYFIDLLHTLGKRGAFLVTGFRGTGKTSFVRYCVDEYDADIGTRILRSSAGRPWFWDKLALLFVALGALVIALLATELLEEAVFTVLRRRAQGTFPVEIVLIIGPLVVCLFPLIYGVSVLSSVFRPEALRDTRGSAVYGPVLQVLGPLLLGGLALGGIYLGQHLQPTSGPLTTPDLAVARALTATAYAILVAQALNLNPTSRETRLLRFPLHWSPVRVVLTGLALVIDILFVSGLSSVGSCLALFLASVAAWLMLRATQVGSLRLGPRDRATLRWYHLALPLCAAVIVSVTLGLDQGTLTPGSDWQSHYWLHAVFLAYTLVLGVTWPPSFEEREGLVPPVQVLLILKAGICILISVQLCYPLVHLLPGWGDEGILAGLRSYQEPHAGTFISTFGRNVELRWVALLLLSAALFYMIEYEWIIRPYGGLARDRSTNPFDTSANADASRVRLRRWISLTLPALAHRALLPVLTVSINLGFERLEHPLIVQAMLAGLRERFHRHFVAWNSAIAITARCLGLLILLGLTKIVGNGLFGLDDDGLDPYTRGRSANGSAFSPSPYDSRPPLPEGAPRIVDVVHALGDGTLASILYADLLSGFGLSAHEGEIPPTQVSARTSRFESAGGTVWGIVKLFPEMSLSMQDWVFRSVTGDSAHRRADAMLCTILQCAPSKNPVHIENQGPQSFQIQFRVCHLITLLALLFIARWVGRRFHAVPYNEMLRRLDAVMDSLGSRRRSSIRTPIGFRGTLASLIGEDSREKDEAPLDPRAVEHRFIELLRDMTDLPLRFPGGPRHRLSIPSPEIVFVFDELDKLGSAADVRASTAQGFTAYESFDLDRLRMDKVRRLIEEMKNILTQAPARFVFVGGRNLHDEWLADATARQPLLSTVFDDEIYLPTLLTDHTLRTNEPHDGPRLSDRIRDYLAAQSRRVWALRERWELNEARPILALRAEERVPDVYVDLLQTSPVENWPGSCPPKAQVSQVQGQRADCARVFVVPAQRENPCMEENACVQAEDSSDVCETFVAFLTYRSLGQPKHLKELVESFVRQASRLVPGGFIEVAGGQVEESRKRFVHALRFSDTDLYRMQLLSDIYHQIAARFERRLVRRDDKLVTSVFRMADFLFKFHRRAFSWANVERVEELVDIHRAADQREVLREMVLLWADRNLHPILNGMYDFRFRSDLAAELGFLSRQAPEEMAAFNFTLDESQALKMAYGNLVREMKDQETPEILGGLGELHEFDGELEQARYYYARAIRALDEKDGIEWSTLRGSNRSFLPHNLAWAMARLRLMLQTGMSFELSQNLERAVAHYQDARTFATWIVDRLLDRQDSWRVDDVTYEEGPRSRLNPLKHLNLLFQPFFAEAWVCEKLQGGVDTSGTLVEQELRRLRKELPFVKELKVPQATPKNPVWHSNFALIMAELHNKAGDLYFFKGSQVVPLEDAAREKTKGTVGFLVRAHYHYIAALSELRRFLTYRRTSAPVKLSLPVDDSSDTLEPIGGDRWPDFLHRAVAASLNDLSESLVARVRFKQLRVDVQERWRGASVLTDPTAQSPGLRRAVTLVENLARHLRDWFERRGDEWPDPTQDWQRHITVPGIELPDQTLTLGKLEDWVGSMPEQSERARDDIHGVAFPRWNCNDQRVIMSVAMRIVGAKFLEQGGYLEDAARELLLVAENGAQITLAALLVGRLKSEPEAPLLSDECVFLVYVLELATLAMERGVELFRRSRFDQDGAVRRQSGSTPCAGGQTDAMVQSYGLGIAIIGLLKQVERLKTGTLGGLDTALGALWKRVVGLVPCKCSAPEEEARYGDWVAQELHALLERNPWPCVTRLRGLSYLIHCQTLAEEGGCSKKNADAVDAMERLAEELWHINTLYRAPLHFTPYSSGLALGAAALRIEDLSPTCAQDGAADGQSPDTRGSLVRHAIEDLNQSEEMCTMRRTFYDVIGGLYYLYDDFNDRQIHFNHALQLTMLDVTRTLKKRLAQLDPTKLRRRSG